MQQFLVWCSCLPAGCICSFVDGFHDGSRCSCILIVKGCQGWLSSTGYLLVTSLLLSKLTMLIIIKDRQTMEQVPKLVRCLERVRQVNSMARAETQYFGLSRLPNCHFTSAAPGMWMLGASGACRLWHRALNNVHQHCCFRHMPAACRLFAARASSWASAQRSGPDKFPPSPRWACRCLQSQQACLSRLWCQASATLCGHARSQHSRCCAHVGCSISAEIQQQVSARRLEALPGEHCLAHLNIW